MCGICGEIRFDGEIPIANEIAHITEQLEPRGPDTGGLFLQDNVALGHRRLSIIDLSNKSIQPMVDSYEGIAIVFNGVIYNYKELRQELTKKGYRFFSNGDTEVIIKSYKEWGEDFANHFNGMFAFALWDRDKEQLVLARDRMGIKPLYYSKNQNSLRFSSTLPSLLAGGHINKNIDPVALHHYMTFHSVVPAPRTIIEGVKKLPPATILTIQSDGTLNFRKYWQVEYEEKKSESLSFEESSELISQSLRNAVKRRLVADVPVGVLLSGGLDSSLIVGLLAQEGQSRLNTFSIGFETIGQEAGDEFKYSDVIAEKFQTTHHKIRVSSEELLQNLPSCIQAMSEPMVSHDNIGFYLLSREVKKYLKVVQSGQGADEIFAGYHWYPPLLDESRGIEDYKALFFDRDHKEMTSVLNADYCNEDYSSQFAEENFDMPGAGLTINKALRLDSTIMLVDDPVKRVDNMTMAWGIEARVPFLDHELVEAAAKIPAKHKVRSGGKYVLKEIARRIIPEEVIDRPKGYFPVPALKHIRGKHLELLKKTLSNEKSQNRNLFKHDYLSMLFDEPDKHITNLRGSKLWQIGLLELWLQTHNI